MKFHEGVLGLLLATFTYVAGSSPAGSGGYYGGAGGYGHPQQQQQHAQQYPGYYQQQQFHQQQQYQQPNYQPQQANQVEDQQAATQEEVAGPAEEVKDGEKGDTGALPEPWQEHIDPSSGRPYYYNPETSVTQWERPEAPAQPVPSPEARPEQHHQHAQTGQHHQPDADTGASADHTMPSDQLTGGDNAAMYGGMVNETVMPKGEEPPQAAGAPLSDGTSGSSAFAAGNNESNSSGVDGRNPDEAPKPEDQPPIRGQSFAGNQQADGNRMPQPFGQPQPMQYSGQSMPGQQPWGVQQPRPVQPLETSSPAASEPQQHAEKSAEPQGQEHGQAQGGPVDPQYQRPFIQRQPNQGMNQQPEIRSQPQMPPGMQTQPDQPNPNQQGDPRRPPNQWQSPPPSQQLPPSQGQQYPPQQGSPQVGGPPQYPGRPGPYGMPPQQPGPQQRGGPPGYPPQPGQSPYGQQPPYGQRPPQYPGQPQYPYNYGAPPQSGPGAGQLVQQRTEDLSNAVKEKWGQALGGLGVFGNRTKELAGNAVDQISESASSAGKTIGETSTGELGNYNELNEFVESKLTFLRRKESGEN